MKRAVLIILAMLLLTLQGVTAVSTNNTHFSVVENTFSSANARAFYFNTSKSGVTLESFYKHTISDATAWLLYNVTGAAAITSGTFTGNYSGAITLNLTPGVTYCIATDSGGAGYTGTYNQSGYPVIGTDINFTSSWYHASSKTTACTGGTNNTPQRWNVAYVQTSSVAIPPTFNTTYTVNVNDLFNDADLAGANVTFYRNTTYVYSALTDASGNAVYTTNGTTTSYLNYTVTLANYSNDTARFVVANGTNTSNLSQAVYTNLTVYSIITTAVVATPFNLSVQGGKNYTLTGAATNIYLRAGAMNFTWSKYGWYNLTFQKNLTAGTNTTTNTTGAYNNILNVTARNAYTNTSIANFTLNITNTTYSYLGSYSTTNGSVQAPTLQGVNVSVYIDAAGYAISNTTNYYSFSAPVGVTLSNYTFRLYTNNSILINIYDEETGLIILSNVSITVSTNSTEFTDYTTTGQLFLDNLTDGEYTIKLLAANYTLRTYTVTVASRSTQTLNAYLSSSTGAVILTIKDSASAATLEGASVALYRYINGTLTLIENKASDITGRAQFTYTTGVKYVFTVDRANYTSKTFSLDPVIFTSYDVFLDRVVSEAHDYADVGIDYNPHVFNNNQNHSFTFLFSSPNGVLTAYNLTMRWPGGSYSGAGNTSNGQTFSTTVNISNAQIMDTVNLTFRYTTVFGDTKTYTRLLGINNGTTVTLAGIEQKLTTDYGMGLFERILLAVLITVLAAGLATMAAGSTAGFIMGLVVMGFFTFTGFIPALATGITFIVGLLLLAKRTGD